MHIYCSVVILIWRCIYVAVQYKHFIDMNRPLFGKDYKIKYRMRRLQVHFAPTISTSGQKDFF